MNRFKVISTIHGTTAKIYPKGSSVSHCALLIEAGVIDATWHITRTKYTYIHNFGIKECNLKQYQKILVTKIIVGGFIL